MSAILLVCACMPTPMFI